jgi:hypothetical protein
MGGFYKMTKTLCKNCDECEFHKYKRYNKKGNLVEFQYCNGNKFFVENNNWWLHEKGYAVTSQYIYGRQRYLHTLFKKNNKKVIDHINGVRNDNRLCNLRQVSQDINCQNKHNERSSEYPGVFWDKKAKAWRCTVSKGHEETFTQKQLGLFKTEEEAYHNYVKALKQDNRKLDVDSKHHQKYLKWLNTKQQAKLV